MSLELSPEVERQVIERAQAAGTTASDYLARLLQAVPAASTDTVARVRSLLHRWQQHDQTPTAPAPNEGTLTPSEVLFRQWEQEDALLSDEERHAEEGRWQPGPAPAVVLLPA